MSSQQLAREDSTMLAFLLLALTSPQSPPSLSHGPFRGANDLTSLRVWARAAAAGSFELHLRTTEDVDLPPLSAQASPLHDLTLQWHVTGLNPGSAYDWWITQGERIIVAAGGAPLLTAPRDASTHALLAFGSCSHDRLKPKQPVWGEIIAHAPQALVLLGDTPYIDHDATDHRQKRHREFFEFAPVRAALSALPTYTVWDDHDYAENDQYGATKSSTNARAVFLDFHAQPVSSEKGIYLSFRRGPIEVFLLDTRTFGDTEPCPFAPAKRTLLGAEQISWLQHGLANSTAPFKLLSCGMVWNGAVRPNKKDCWGNFLHERDGLLRWIGAQQIQGVILIGGDVHRSRMIVHPVQELVGYDVPELITSPLAQNVIAENNVDLPGLRFDAGEPEAFLLVQADSSPGEPVLCARFCTADGRELHACRFTLAALTSKKPR